MIIKGGGDMQVVLNATGSGCATLRRMAPPLARIFSSPYYRAYTIDGTYCNGVTTRKRMALHCSWCQEALLNAHARINNNERFGARVDTITVIRSYTKATTKHSMQLLHSRLHYASARVVVLIVTKRTNRDSH